MSVSNPSNHSEESRRVEAHYDSLAGEWDATFGSESINPEHRASCLRAFRAMTADVTGTDTAVELGVGTGLFTDIFARRFRRLIAVDLSQAMLTELSKKLNAIGIENVVTLKADALDLSAVPAASADLVYFFGLMENLQNPSRMFAEAVRLLRPGGSIAGIVSNAQCPYYLVRRLLPSSAKFFADVRLYTGQEVRSLIDGSGLTDCQIRYWGTVPLAFQPGIVSRSLSALEPVIRTTPLVRWLGGIAFSARRPVSATPQAGAIK